MSRRLLITLLSAVFAALLFPVPAHAASRQDPTCPSLEGCYSYDQMQAFYDQVILMIDSFSSAEYQGDMPHPEYWYVESDELLTTRCDGDADGLAFAYCSADRTVYVGQDQLWDFYRMSGDGAAAFAVAHEWGHHVQHTVGVYDLFVDDQASYIEAENQADCIGGAFLAHLRDQGILEQDDYADVGAVLPKIASAESDVYRDHGTVEERVEATRYGLANGLEGCSEYFPAAASLI